MRPALEIRRESLTSPAAVTLIATLNAELSARYPEDGATHFRLEPEEVAEGRGAFLIVYSAQQAVGCGAVRRLDERSAEIKRMYVEPCRRGQGLGRRLLEALCEQARQLGVERIVLETGTRQSEAQALYRSAGFTPIPPYGEYVGSPLSVCMEKRLRT